MKMSNKRTSSSVSPAAARITDSRSAALTSVSTTSAISSLAAGCVSTGLTGAGCVDLKGNGSGREFVDSAHNRGKFTRVTDHNLAYLEFRTAPGMPRSAFGRHDFNIHTDGAPDDTPRLNGIAPIPGGSRDIRLRLYHLPT